MWKQHYLLQAFSLVPVNAAKPHLPSLFTADVQEYQEVFKNRRVQDLQPSFWFLQVPVVF